MKAIVITAPGQLEWKDWPMPEPGPGQVRIRTGACGICATDLEIIRGSDRISFPAILGHEWAGTIDAVGEGVDESLIGRKCVAENVLSDGLEVGFEHPGGYSEYFVTESTRVQILPDSFPLTIATLVEPLAVCVRAVRRLGNANGKPLLLFGDGPIGLLMLLLLKRSGCENIALVGGRESRLALAAEFGATRVLDYHLFSGKLSSALQNELRGKIPLIVEATGSSEAINASLELGAMGCKILLIGDYGKACAKFEWNHLIHRELELIASVASAEAWPEAVRLAVEGKLPLNRLITHTLPAEQYESGIDIAGRRDAGAIKVVLEWSKNA